MNDNKAAEFNPEMGAPIRKTYAYHKPSPEGLAKIEELRALYTKMHDILEELCPKSRELSKGLTELEDSCMWVIKSVVCNDPNSEVVLNAAS